MKRKGYPMKHYIFGNQSFEELPGLLQLADGSTVSPVTVDSFVAHGGIITDDGAPEATKAP